MRVYTPTVENVEKVLGTKPGFGWTSNPNEAFLAPLELSPDQGKSLADAVRRLGLRLPALGEAGLGGFGREAAAAEPNL